MADTTANTTEKSKKKSWFKGMKSEFKKISWPAKDMVLKQSAAVIVITIVLGLFISVLDTVLGYGVNFLIGL